MMISWDYIETLNSFEQHKYFISREIRLLCQAATAHAAICQRVFKPFASFVPKISSRCTKFAELICASGETCSIDLAFWLNVILATDLKCRSISFSTQYKSNFDRTKSCISEKGDSPSCDDNIFQPLCYQLFHWHSAKNLSKWTLVNGGRKRNEIKPKQLTSFVVIKFHFWSTDFRFQCFWVFIRLKKNHCRNWKQCGKTWKWKHRTGNNCTKLQELAKRPRLI